MWARQVRKATVTVEEKAVLNCLRALLPKVHPLDYEKIRYLCTWIVAALAEEVEQEQDNTIQRNARQETGTGAGGSVPGSGSGMGLGRGQRESDMKVRSDSFTAKATEEAESCRRYADIVTYLAGLTFPLQATKAISKAVQEKIIATTSTSNTTSTSTSGTISAGVSLSVSTSVNGATYGSNNNCDNSGAINSTNNVLTPNSGWESCYIGVPTAYLSRVPFWVRK